MLQEKYAKLDDLAAPNCYVAPPTSEDLSYVVHFRQICKRYKEWRDAHPNLKGNIRDYANVSQLVCLSNLENLNAVFINEGIPQAERLAKLNAIAISQMKVLTEDHRLLQLDAAEDK